jgi:hypothetical protein
MPSPEAAGRLRLIVNADDFGFDEDTVEATVECFRAGALTSATIMLGMPATDQAFEFARGNPELDVGVHLSFTGDFGQRPLAGAERVPSLVDPEGRFLPVRTMRSRALAGRLAQGELELEIEAQVRAVREAGVQVSHVDSHRHVHKLGSFRAALARVLPGLGIRRVRTAQDVYVTRPLTSPTYWAGPRWRRQLRKAFETTDHFFMAAVPDPPWSTPLAARLEGLTGTLEVGVHPGRAQDWRDRDRRALLELAAGLDDRVELSDWRSL